MRPIRTLKDVLHAVMNSLSLISSHSQYLLGKAEAAAPAQQELQIIYEEAERAATLLSLVPQKLAGVAIQDAASPDVAPERSREGAEDASHGKGRP